MSASAWRIGGFPARRAITRWAWRSFRREWRQQALVLGLLVTAVATSILFGTVIFNTTGVREQARFGAANHRYELADFDRALIDRAVRVAADRFGEVDVIARWTAPLPGSVDTVDYLAQDPDGAYAAPMLALVDGRFPTTAGDAAITDGLSETLGKGIGDVIELDGEGRAVVGIAENPSDLQRDFVLTSFVAAADRAESASLLFGGSGTFAEVKEIRAFAADRLPEGELTTRGDGDRDRAAAAVLAVAQVALILVALVASAGFAAIAQRRLRQIGLLGAIGATDRHLALVVLVDGVIVGAIAAVAGAAIGLTAWVTLAPHLEEPVGYRIDTADLPWLLVVGTLVATVVTSTAAAWVPARTASRRSIVGALARRPPEVAPVGRSARLALAVTVTGLALLLAGRTHPMVRALGTLLSIAGVLVSSPILAKLLGVIAKPLPIAARLPLRDLARYRSRSSTALAGVGLALGIPVAIIAVSAATEADEGLPNLPADQLIVWTKDESQPDGASPFYTVDESDEGFSPYLPELDQRDLDSLEQVVSGAARDLDATLTPLEAVVDPNLQDRTGEQIAVTVARQTDLGYLDVALVYAATPDVLAAYEQAADASGLLTTGPAGPSSLVTDTDTLWLANTADVPRPVTDSFELPDSFASLPGTMLAADEIRQRGWTTTTVGWLITAGEPLQPEQIGDLRDLASREGLVVEAPEAPADLTDLRWGATALGILVALAVLGMTVGLIRVEAIREDRVLDATGANPRVRRTITAITAGSLAAGGAVLGGVGAYLTLVAGYLNEIGPLHPVPIAPLAAILLGLPLLAAAIGFAVTTSGPRTGRQLSAD